MLLECENSFLHWNGEVLTITCGLLQGLCKGSNGWKTISRPFLQSFEDDRIDSFRKSRIKVAGWLWTNIEVLIHDLLLPSTERKATSEQVIGQYSQSILISGGNRFSAPLLRGHIGRCATDSLARTYSSSIKLSDAKICKQQVWVVRMLLVATNEEIRWFDILMHYAVIMGILKGISGLAD